jgi:hypothetical protein
MNYLTLLEAAEAAAKTKNQKTEEDIRIEALNHEALSLAAVVSYCRPFTSNYRISGGKKPSWIPKAKGFVKTLPDDLPTFHDWIETLRNETWAHTAEPAFKGNLIQSIPEALIPKFKALIQAVRDRLQVNESPGK